MIHGTVKIFPLFVKTKFSSAYINEQEPDAEVILINAWTENRKVQTFDNTILILDEAQTTYGDKDFWSRFKNPGLEGPYSLYGVAAVVEKRNRYFHGKKTYFFHMHGSPRVFSNDKLDASQNWALSDSRTS